MEYVHYCACGCALEVSAEGEYASEECELFPVDEFRG